MFVRATQKRGGESIVLGNVNTKAIKLENMSNALRAERKYTKHKERCIIRKVESTFAINPVLRFGKIVISSSENIILAGKMDKVLTEK